MSLWQRLAIHPASRHSPRGISRAALQGASLDDLCQEVYSSLEQALQGKAERFGVWLAPSSCESDKLFDPGSFQGRFWSDGREEEFPEWEVSGHRPAFPSALLNGGATLEQLLHPPQIGNCSEPVAGMRRALWIPVRLGGDLKGVLFAATRSSSAKFPREEMDRAAAELALALGFRAEASIAHARAGDLAESRAIWAKISEGVSLDGILQDITNSALQSALQRTRAARFATLGIPPNYTSQPASASALDFRWYAGDGVLARSAASDPVAGIWRKALETRRTVGSALPARWSHTEISRVVAVPLLISGSASGVLVVGYHGHAASLANLERLELRANLAAAAISMSGHQPSTAAAMETSQFLVQNTFHPVFLLNVRQQVTIASNAGKALLAAGNGAASRATAAANQGQNSLGSVAQIFPPPEWPRISAWLSKVAERGASSPADSIEAELSTGHRVRLHAAPHPSGGLALLLREVAEKENPGDRVTTELRSLIEWMEQGVLLFDENENLRFMNQRFVQLFGLTPEDLDQANGLRALVGLVAAHVADPTRFAASWWDAARGVEPSLREVVRVLQPAPRFVERISRPVLNPAGMRLGRIEIYRDLTAEQLFQSKLHKSERLAALGQNVSGVAHELSNPLTTILGYAQRLLRNSGDSPARDAIQRIFSEADRASSILRQLLGSAREASPERRSIDLNPLILHTVELQRFQLASENICVELELSPSLPPVLGDTGQFQQILMNLISNARHALLQEKSEGVITVRTAVSNSGRVLFEVSDSGPGIPEAHIHRIFDPFFTTKPAGIGTGLGLSIVMGLVHQNNGNINVQSVVGQGAKFSMDFPAAKSIPALRVPDLPPALSSVPVSPASGRVLVVEDEPTVAQLIADMLSDLGYSSDIRHDARRALVSALNQDYALIICDMKMPGLDGQHFYRALAEASSPLAAKFLFVTGDVLAITTQEFLRKHRLPHIAKPFRIEEFSEKVTLVLGRTAAACSPPVAVPAISG